MATRRSRIKGVLNIPARRKTGEPSKEDDVNEQDVQTNNNEEKTITSGENGNDDNNASFVPEKLVAEEIPQKVAENSAVCNRTVLSNLQSSKLTLPNLNVSVFRKLPATVENAVRINIEAPPSPTKMNRTRIKAIPRLGNRRVSFSLGSASESEDDGRRQPARHRNDSVCSIASNVDENRHQQVSATGGSIAGAGTGDTQTICPGPGPVVCTSSVKKEFNCVIQRKCRRTEQARKMATAKRDFYHKFSCSKPPDRHRLTMMDLIFYNPTTNPMSVDCSKGNTTREDKDEENVNSDVEDVDDPGKKSEEELDDPDDQDDTIAPQITVNADGEIIIDEKSLLIENKSTVKGRQKMERANLVDGDEHAGYGIYKRVKRTKDWAKAETLRFYKALNTIGTDFTLMVKLFPNRTRRELKMKFKKEERINHALIDKAVLEPVHFDISDLEADLEKELLIEKELKLRKKEVSEARSIIRQKRHEKSHETTSRETVKDLTQPTNQSGILNRTEDNNESKSNKTIVNSVLDVLDESDDENNTESEVEEEEENSKDGDDYVPPSTHNLTTLSVGVKRPRRNLNSRHIYKNTKLARIETLSINSENNDHNSSTKDDSFSNEENLEPGSLMIVKKSGNNPTDPEFLIYMITADKKKVPIDLSSDIVKNLASNGTIAENHDIILGLENNYTIDEELVENNYTINEEEGECKVTGDVDKPAIASPENAEQIISALNEEQIQNAGDILILPLD